MKIILYKNNSLLAQEDFDSKLYYENTYSSLAVKYKLVSVDSNYFNNDLDGFKIRENLIVDKSIKKQVYTKTTEDIKLVLDYIDCDYLVLTNNEILDYYNNLSGIELGNISDIKEWLEENFNTLKLADKMIVER